MPKKIKKDLAPDASSAAVSAIIPAQSEQTAGPKRKRAAMAPKSASAKTATKKKPARAAAKVANKPRSKPAKRTEPSDADISLRAYFIAERRVQLALQGDPAKDWLEAKRQLLEEAAQKKS